MRKYRLTLLFLVVSVVIIGMAAVAINVFSARAAEANLVSLAKSQAARDTKLIADLITRLMDSDGNPGVTTPGASAAPGDISVVRKVDFAYPELLSALNVVEVKLFDTGGNTIWTSGDRESGTVLPDEGLFTAAVGGRVTSDLKRDADIVDVQGDAHSADVVQTYIPVLTAEDGDAVAVLAVTRDVTGDLAAHTGQLQKGLLKTTMLSMGGVFVALLGVVLVADRRIWKANSLALAGERMVSSGLAAEKEYLARLNESKGRFLSTVSHELMTPLTSTLAFVELVLRNKDKNLTQPQVHQLEVARRNAHRLMRLINDLLDLSRAEQGTLSIAPSEFDARQWIEEAAQEVAPALQAKSQPLKLSLPEPGQNIHADRDRLTQVVQNLLSNASKYSAQGHEIELIAKLDASSLTVTVRDHGIGMSAEEQRGLFTMFYRVDSEHTRDVPGSGIGLAISKEIVGRHGGDIAVTSDKGAGTTVTFHVPRQQGKPISASEQPPAQALAKAA